jgi:hypothetical protein
MIRILEPLVRRLQTFAIAWTRLLKPAIFLSGTGLQVLRLESRSKDPTDPGREAPMENHDAAEANGARSVPRILFSTTLAWNPGDEVILAGIENLFAAKRFTYDRLVYNRNAARYQESGWQVFAGSPKRCQEVPPLADLRLAPLSPRFWMRPLGIRLTDRVNDPLLTFILDSGIRCAAIGVGTSKKPVTTRKISRILQERADVLITRDRQTTEVFAGFSPRLMPCPAFFAAKDARPRRSLDRIAVGLQAPGTNLIRMDSTTAARSVETARRIADRFAHVEFICHAERDRAFVSELFPGRRVHFVCGGAEMVEAYGAFDAVLSTRLHGCVVACSHGIPTFRLFGGLRMEALKRFPVSDGDRGLDPLSWLDELDPEAESRKILAEKERRRLEFLELFDELSPFRETR